MFTLSSHNSHGGGLRRVVVVLLLVASTAAAFTTSPSLGAGTASVRTLTFTYTSHDGLSRLAYVVVPASYGPGNNPGLPVVISPHGRNANGLSNSKFFGNLPAVGQFAVISPDGMGRKDTYKSYGYKGQIDDLARMPELAEAPSRGSGSTTSGSTRSGAAWAARRRLCSSRAITSCSPAPPRWTRSPTSRAATASC